MLGFADFFAYVCGFWEAVSFPSPTLISFGLDNENLMLKESEVSAQLTNVQPDIFNIYGYGGVDISSHNRCRLRWSAWSAARNH